jgi:uncharacterized HAD superfamily protein
MIYCFDLDGTLCSHESDYNLAKPINERIKVVNSLYDENNVIIIDTARGSTTGVDWYEITQNQLKKWNVKYHELRVDKPYYDLFIDDKTLRIEEV